MSEIPVNRCNVSCIFQTPLTCNHFQENEEFIIYDETTNRTFFHNYPSSPYIHAVRIFGGKSYSQSYKILCLGQYPTRVNYTKKEKEIKYKIPDNYQVETVLGGLVVLCKTNYQYSRKVTVKYTIEWADENGEIKSRYSLSSASAASSLFLKVSLIIFPYLIFIQPVYSLRKQRKF